MDYENLFAILPKEPKKWSREDDCNLFKKFLVFIDGYKKQIIQQMDHAQNQLKKTTQLMIQELTVKQLEKSYCIKGLKIGLKEYLQHLKSVFAEDQRCDKIELENVDLENTEQAQAQYGQADIQHDMMTNYIKNNQMISQQFQQPLCEIEHKPQFQKKQQNEIQLEQESQNMVPKVQNELIIEPTEGPQTNFYCIKQQGGKIGRHSSNQILILEESISRFHAEIVFQNDEFLIKDIGSTAGTFIKIESKMELQVGMIVELGSNQFEIQQLNINNQIVEVVMLIVEGINLSEKHIIALNPQRYVTTVGRKQTADLTFSEDHHLSNIHAKICFIDGHVYLEDMGSTNGSWLRLSKEGQFSKLYPLRNQTIFKIGTTSTYLCRISSQIVVDQKNENNCIICIENDRDALYMPCKHNTACLKCSKNLKECPICRTKIQDVIKIYKN